MATRKNPQTSLDAHKSLQPEQLRETYKQILDALKVLGTASSEQIATYLTVDHSKIHKRTKEMEGMELIFRPGHRVPTKSGCTAYVWQLCGNQPKTTKAEKALKGNSVSDYSKKISEIGKQQQQKLF